MLATTAPVGSDKRQQTCDCQMADGATVHHSVTPPQAHYEDRPLLGSPPALGNGTAEEVLLRSEPPRARSPATGSCSPVQRGSVRRSWCCLGSCFRPAKYDTETNEASQPAPPGQNTSANKQAPEIGPGRMVYPSSANGKKSADNDDVAQTESVTLSPDHVVSPVPNVKRYALIKCPFLTPL